MPAEPVALDAEQETRVERLLRENILISLHEHLGVFPADVSRTPDWVREARVATAFEGLAASAWDAVFDNLLDGICTIESRGGWKWTEVVHDLGMRLCDLAHQDFVIHCRGIEDIGRAHAEGRVAWVASIEGAAMIENELDRIEILYGLRSTGDGDCLLGGQCARFRPQRGRATAASPSSAGGRSSA